MPKLRKKEGKKNQTFKNQNSRLLKYAFISGILIVFLFLLSVILNVLFSGNSETLQIVSIIQNVLTSEEQSQMIKNLENFNEIFGIATNDVIKQYLDECYFIGLFSQAFLDEFQYNPQEPKLNQGKQDAINKFVNFARDFAKRVKIPLKVGFSDDDKNFSNAAKELFMKMEKSLDFPENFYVFDTSNPKIKGGVKVKI